MAQVLTKDDSWSNAIVAGATIWRPVAFSCVARSLRYACRPMHVSSVFQKAPGGGFIARIATPSVFMMEPEVIPATTRDGKARQGLVIFLNELPPDDWTHLVVKDLTSKLKTASCTEKGGGVYAEYDKPYAMDDYCAFRAAMLEATMKFREAPFDEMMDAMSEIWPTEERVGAIRLFIRPSNDGVSEWTYDTLEDGPESDDVE